MEALTTKETKLLRKSETAIRKATGLQARAEATYVDEGRAFKIIRDGDLYRATHKTFELYCQETWRCGRRKICRLIAASDVAMVLGPNGLTFPATESQARELVPLIDKPDTLTTAWQQFRAEVERPTAGKLRHWLQAHELIPAPAQGAILTVSDDRAPDLHMANVPDDLLAAAIDKFGSRSAAVTRIRERISKITVGEL